MSTNAYTLHFADGKRCTLIDPERESMEDLEKGLKSIFAPGYLITITEGLTQPAKPSNNEPPP